MRSSTTAGRRRHPPSAATATTPCLVASALHRNTHSVACHCDRVVPPPRRADYCSSCRPPTRSATATSRRLTALAPRQHRCASPPAGTATTTSPPVAATALAPPPVVQTAGHCSPRQQPRQRRRVSQATATEPTTPPAAGLLLVARPRWCRLGCVSHVAARPPRRSLVATARALGDSITRRPRARRYRASYAITRRRCAPLHAGPRRPIGAAACTSPLSSCGDVIYRCRQHC